jgi:AmmeMemoRadiSam system protein A
MTTWAPLPPADRAALLALARAALLARLGLVPPPAPPAQGPLAAPGAAFVTVVAGGEVRASLGALAPEGPLGATVARLAARALDGDPRFPPLTAADAPALSLRLAVLGPLRPVSAAAPVRLGAEGLAVTQGWHRALLLPSAAEGRGWDAPQFLKHACLAAGLPARAHLEPGTVIEAFEAQEFGEP